MRIGVDVGGTNTDAAVMDGNRVLASTKAPTTEDVALGVVQSIRDVLAKAGVAKRDIESVMIGTTQFTNAFVERRRLSPVATIRLGLPAGSSLPPLTGWPEALIRVIGRHATMLAGGFEVDGREISPLDEAGIALAARQARAAGIDSFAISSIFSPIDASMEQRARKIVLEHHADARVTLASEIGRLGLIERENAAIMNASLADLSRQIVGAFRDALVSLDLRCPFFVSQNDGTLMGAEVVERYPVLTFASGPTNSMRGAAYLSNLQDAVVVDIGGTTSDIGVLQHGFPRESAVPVDIGGVRTNFRMPDVLALGLGGGSVVHTDAGLRIGPDSVGFRLTAEALVFGGNTLTATDIAVAAGYATVGNPTLIEGRIPAELVEAAVVRIHEMIEDGIDRVKTSASSAPVVLVGGGSVLVSRPLQGVTRLIKPERSAEANAIGAAIAQVGGEVDRIFRYSDLGREASLLLAKQEASNKAINAGADPDSLEVVDIEEIPLGYGAGETVRVRAKVIGDLALKARP